MTSDRPVTGALVALIGAFVVVAMGTTLLGSKVFLGVDAMVANDPWRSELIPPEHQVANACIGDTINVLTPWRAHFRSRLFGGDFALWEPLGVGGSPLAALPNAGVLSPLNLPHLLVAPWFAPALAKLFELCVSVGFMYLFLRRIRLSKPSALVGGLAFSASGFLVVWTNWNQAHVTALIPALFWAGERYLQLRTPRSAMPIAVVVAVMLAEGFPAVTGYAVAAWLPYFAVRLIGEDRRFSLRQWRVLGGAGAAVALGAGLLALQLVPFLSGLDAITETRRQGPNDHLPLGSLISLALPRAYGAEPTCGAIEESAYVGVGALVLVAVALARPRRAALPPGVRRYFLTAVAVTVVLGWVGGPLLTAAQVTPLFAINPVGRIRALLGFLLAVVAAIGFESLRRGARERHDPGRWQTGTVWVGSTLLAALGVLEVSRRISSPDGRFDHLGRDLVIALVLALLAGLGVLAVSQAGVGIRQLGAIVVAATIALQGAGFARWFWPRADRDFYYPETTVHRFLADHLGEDRFAASDFTMTPGTSTLYGLRSATGRGFTQASWADLLKSADPNVFKSPTYSAPSLHVAGAPALDRLAVRYFVTPGGPPPFGHLDSGPAGQESVPLPPGRPLEVDVPAGGLRGVGLILTSTGLPLDPFARLAVTVVDEQGHAVGSGFRRVYAPVSEEAFVVPVAPEIPPEAEGLKARFVLHGAAGRVATAEEAYVVPVIRSHDDGLRLSFAGGALVWERMKSLPRIRWASRTRLLPDERRRIDLLAGGSLAGDEVVLHEEGPAADGAPAAVTVHQDSGDFLQVGVEATGSGYLVVSDAMQRNWVAKLNGRRVALREADHALVAVAVPPGVHEVTLEYHPPLWRIGLAVTALSAAVVVGLWWVNDLRRRPTRPVQGRGSV